MQTGTLCLALSPVREALRFVSRKLCKPRRFAYTEKLVNRAHPAQSYAAAAEYIGERVENFEARNAESTTSRFDWIHESHGSFIRGEPSVSLLSDSTGKWTLRIYKAKGAFGLPITYEIAFAKRYAETIEQAVAMANTILRVELCS